MLRDYASVHPEERAARWTDGRGFAAELAMRPPRVLEKAKLRDKKRRRVFMERERAERRRERQQQRTGK